MNRIAPIFAALTLAAATASAQTTAPAPSPSTTTPPAAAPAQNTTVLPKSASAPTLTDEQAKSWIDKKVYSSDQKDLGEVVQFMRDSTGKVSELHADIGGFLGIGETRVRVMPEQFRLDGDKVVLNLKSDQAKTLPKIAK